jgi:hypothetical protein
MKPHVFSLLLLIAFSTGSFAQSLTKLWTTGDGIKTPESVLFDAVSNKIFVSNINGQPSDKDGNGFTSMLDADGKIIKLDWITGLNAPKGQAVYNGTSTN